VPIDSHVFNSIWTGTEAPAARSVCFPDTVDMQVKRGRDGYKVTIGCPSKSAPEYKHPEVSISKELYDCLNEGPLPTAHPLVVLQKSSTTWFTTNVRALASGAFHAGGPLGSRIHSGSARLLDQEYVDVLEKLRRSAELLEESKKTEVELRFHAREVELQLEQAKLDLNPFSAKNGRWHCNTSLLPSKQSKEYFVQHHADLIL
jgi:hypothetical protein